MSPTPKRPSTLADRDADGFAARRERDALHEAVLPVDDDFTGQYERGEIDAEELKRRRSRRPTPDRVTRLEEQRDADTADVRELKVTIRDRFDRLDRHFERLDGRMDRHAERTTRAELLADDAQDAAKSLAPRLDTILTQLGDVKRLADGVERISARFEVHDKRLGAVETEQQLAKARFEDHDKRDKGIEATVHRIEKRVGELETANTVEDATAKVKKQVAKLRPWWLSGKGMATVIAAIAAAVATIYAAASAGGCS